MIPKAEGIKETHRARAAKAGERARKVSAFSLVCSEDYEVFGYIKEYSLRKCSYSSIFVLSRSMFC
ncbi:unnamed protein product [Strongylus vulgaris]|uniref:Uncharacterized protein n=1 Tax=Strongylus vulgaris TaxID=40348 RepID=A0A3P7JIL2_STRVU|nr:unnamed protein product [Strongylus vulgaris]